MDVFRPELHSFSLRAILDEAEASLGHEPVARVLARYGLSRERLSDPSAWVSLEFYESLLDGLNACASGDPDLLERAMLRAMSPKYLGPLYPLLFAFGSPSFTYGQQPRAAARLNKTGRLALQARRRGFARLAWVPLPNAPREAKSYVCLARRTQLEHVPVAFDLAPAQVAHEQCLLRGDDACVYEVHWHPLRKPFAILGAALGAFVGAISALGTSGLTAAGIAVGFGAGGWAFGRLWTLHRELRKRDADMKQQRAALEQVTRENEERYADLAAAKARADREVEQRTRQLRDATDKLGEALELQAIAQRLPPANLDADSSGPERTSAAASAALALIAVGDPELRQLVRDTLLLKYRVHLAADGDEAIELARTLQPDVVISDIGANRLNGLELCHQLRAGDHTKGLPLLLLTPSGAGHAREGFEAGATDCVSVPFAPDELLARAELHVRLRRLTGQLARQERLAALGSLAASVAHNVRNPLSALISGLPAMRKRLHSHLDESTSELMDVMLDCAARIERMTLDLLDLSRIDRDSSGDFAPGSGLLASTRMFAARLDGPTVTLDTDVDVTAMTSGRAGDVNHVFMNVIDNSLRAIEGKGRIAVRGVVDAGFYVVTIGDSGPGIDEDELTRVFEPFWTTRAAGEGTGLGLSIARQIVEEHGGTIAAGRSPLGGAEFTIRLPLRRAERAA